MFPTNIDKSKLVASPLGDNYSKIEVVGFTNLLDGSKYDIDQMPLLAARISSLREGKTGENSVNDEKLLSETLSQNRHLTPFQHIAVTFRVVAPIFVIREWQRHRMQSYNEMSARYLKEYPMRFYAPKKWRRQSRNNKQGSGDEFDLLSEEYFKEHVLLCYETCSGIYKHVLRDNDVASELARIVLPVGIYSEMYATTYLRNWYEFYELRATEDAQWEIRQYALAIGRMLKYLFPDSWGALSKWKTVNLSDVEISNIIAAIDASNAQVISVKDWDKLREKLLKINRRV